LTAAWEQLNSFSKCPPTDPRQYAQEKFRIGKMVGYGECSNEPPGSMKCKEFLNWSVMK